MWVLMHRLPLLLLWQRGIGSIGCDGNCCWKRDRQRWSASDLDWKSPLPQMALLTKLMLKLLGKKNRMSVGFLQVDTLSRMREGLSCGWWWYTIPSLDMQLQVISRFLTRNASLMVSCSGGGQSGIVYDPRGVNGGIETDLWAVHACAYQHHLCLRMWSARRLEGVDGQAFLWLVWWHDDWAQSARFQLIEMDLLWLDHWSRHAVNAVWRSEDTRRYTGGIRAELVQSAWQRGNLDQRLLHGVQHNKWRLYASCVLRNFRFPLWIGRSSMLQQRGTARILMC